MFLLWCQQFLKIQVILFGNSMVFLIPSLNLIGGEFNMKIYRLLSLFLCIIIISGCESNAGKFSEKSHKINKIDKLSNLDLEKESYLSSGVVNDNKFYFQSSRRDQKYNISKTDKIFSYDMLKDEVKELAVDYYNTIFEFVEFEGSYIYTEVIPGENEMQPYSFQVIEEKNHVKKVLNEGITFSWLELPRYAVYEKKLYTIIKKIVPIENYPINVRSNLDYALMCYEDGALKRVYGKTQEINDFMLNEDATMLGSTWFDNSISDKMLMIYENSKNKCLIRYLRDGKCHEYNIPFSVVEVLTFDDYIIIQNEDMKTKILNIDNQKITDFDYEGIIYSSVYVGENSRIFYNEEGKTKIMHINSDGKGEYLNIDLEKGNENGYPAFYYTKESILIQHGLDHYVLTINFNGL